MRAVVLEQGKVVIWDGGMAYGEVLSIGMVTGKTIVECTSGKKIRVSETPIQIANLIDGAQVHVGNEIESLERVLRIHLENLCDVIGRVAQR